MELLWPHAKERRTPLAGGGAAWSEVTIINHHDMGTQTLGAQFFEEGKEPHTHDVTVFLTPPPSSPPKDLQPSCPRAGHL